jgi:uncharacterized membrane protein YgcG
MASAMMRVARGLARSHALIEAQAKPAVALVCARRLASDASGGDGGGGDSITYSGGQVRAPTTLERPSRYETKNTSCCGCCCQAMSGQGGFYGAGGARAHTKAQ